MFRPDLKDLLEEGLAQLRSGAGLEDVLARHPEQADLLRPLLETAWLAQILGADVSDLKTAQNRSRARFLGAAHERRNPARLTGLRRLTRMRMAGAVALIAVMLFASLVGTGLSSASAVPGQALYPVKRAVEQAQMALTTRQSSRLELEVAFDQRRMLEAETLLHADKIQAVTFAGFLWEDPQQGWFVDLVKLTLTPEQEVMAYTLDGSYVEIKGVVRGEAGVEVSELKLRLYHLDGILENVQAEKWVVSGVTVQIQPSTQVIGNPKKGMRVELTAVRLKDGQYLALSAKPAGKGSSDPLPGSDEDRKPPNLGNSLTPPPPVNFQATDQAAVDDVGIDTLESLHTGQGDDQLDDDIDAEDSEDADEPDSDSGEDDLKKSAKPGEDDD